jgi:hypothetical protein
VRPGNRKLWISLVVLVALSPLGIIVPTLFDSEGSWGEWGADTIKEMVGYVPEGLRRTADLWKAPVPGYNLGAEKASLASRSGSYILSALVGLALVAGIAYALSKIVVRKKQDRRPE